MQVPGAIGTIPCWESLQLLLFVSMFASQKSVLKAVHRVEGSYGFELSLERGKLELISRLSHLYVGMASLFPKTQFPKLQDAHTLPSSPRWVAGGLCLVLQSLS